VLTGCSANFDPKLTGPVPSNFTGSIQGMVHGGQGPIYNAAVYVFETGRTGYPSASVAGNQSIIGSTGSYSGIVNGTNYGNYVLTNAQGLFTIPTFTCTNQNDVIYLVSVGGQPIAGTTNTSATEMAAMGLCPSAGASSATANFPFVTINEVSTAAMAYAFGGFTLAGYDFSHISTSATNIAGIDNAYTNFTILDTVTSNNGANSTSPIDSANITLHAYTKLNTMANVLADCVNSGGTTSTSAPCYTLFQNATSNGVANGGTIPTDTASAMINITHNVQSNVSTIYGLASNSYAPYGPTLSAAPSDFSMSIQYNASGMYDPYQIAIDSTGAVYALSQYTSTGSTSPAITKFTQGAGYVGNTSLSSLSSLAIDQNNNILIVNQNSNLPVVAEYASSNTAALGSASSSPPVFSTAPAIGSNVYVAPTILVGPTNNVELDTFNAIYNAPYSSGSYGASSLLTGSNASSAYGFAADGIGTTWFVSSAPETSQKVNSAGTFASTSIGTSTPLYEAIDAKGRAVVLGFTTAGDSPAVVWLMSTTDVSIIASSALDGSLAGTGGSPSNPAIDGLGNVWVSNVTSGYCRVQSLTTSVTAVYINYGIYVDANAATSGNCVHDSDQIYSPAVDQSGNLWVPVRAPSNFAVSGYLSEILGVGAPTIQPLSVQTKKLLPTNTSFDIRP
jgi:hypothetical protein